MRTFTRWCNECLKGRDIVINKLTTDLSDGLILTALYEVLAKKKVENYNKKPKNSAQRIDNINIALTHIESENIPLVNIRK